MFLTPPRMATLDACPMGSISSIPAYQYIQNSTQTPFLVLPSSQLGTTINSRVLPRF